MLNAFESAGIERERLTTVDSNKVDDAIDVTQPAEADVYEIDQPGYIRKADVDEDEKETCLQELKDQLAATEGEEAEQLRDEIDELEDRIAELTEFRSGRSFHNSRPSG